MTVEPTEIILGEARIRLDPAGVAFLPEESLLVVADLHLEKAQHFARRGQMLPPYDSLATLQRLASAVDRLRPQRILALGDSFHAADLDLDPAGPACMLLDRLASDCDWIWVTGNHDPALPVHLPGRVLESVEIRSLRLAHQPAHGGHEMFGHYHPSARLQTRGGTRRCRCFLASADRLLLPAFGALTGSMDVFDPQMAGLFDPPRSRAYLMSGAALHPVPMVALAPLRRHRLTG